MRKQKFDAIKWLDDAASLGKMPRILRGETCIYIAVPPLPRALHRDFVRNAAEVVDAVSKFTMI
jgi:hypothetical protein